MITNKTIGEQIASRYGLTPKSEWSIQIENALNLLSVKHGSSPDEMCQRVLRDSNALREVAGFLTIDESYFFRQQNHFDQLLQHIYRRLGEIDANTKIMILSAGCAYGSEPYSLAILLKERVEPRRLGRIEIAACDLDLRAIESAREGIFHQWSFRETNAITKELYFRKLAKDRYQIRDDIRAMVTFHHLSIQEKLNTTPLRSLDAVLFRNVAVYMDANSVNDLYQTITRVLRQGGLLLVSATDPQPAKPELRARVSEDTTIYQLNDDSSFAQLRPNGFDLGKKRIGLAQGSQGGFRSMAARRGKSKRRVEPKATGQSPSKSILVARMLADRGEYGQALVLCHQVIDGKTECGEAHRLRGELRLLGLQPSEALEDFQRAVFLKPDDPICRYWYAIGLEAAGNYNKALREVRQLIDSLASLPSTELLSDGETAVSELLLAATSLERNLE